MRSGAGGRRSPTAAQRAYLRRGLGQPGGKLPLFDDRGQRYPGSTIRSCIERGWAEPWFENPIKPDWLVCRLTLAGRNLVEKYEKTNN
ncbi:hypothetical protein [Algihabitans albus]|uniref:hypothetical protein n=1 Tax=Algihabitans albus TaxID=2164067 RepID=UPI0038B37C86